MKKRLYIDFDGVVMDTIPVLYSALEKSGADLNNERYSSLHSILEVLSMMITF